MKKLILKILFFGGIFILCFEFSQYVLIMACEEIRDLRKTESFYRKNTNKIDVCLTGSSPIYAGISPMVLWNRAGITSVNLGMSSQTALCSYFQVKNFLDIYLPKLIIVDLCALFEARNADEQKYKNTYHIVVNSITNPKNKYEFIEAICKENKKQEILYYILPFFRYHSQWGQFRLKQMGWGENFRGGCLYRKCYSSFSIPETYIEEMQKDNLNKNSLIYYEKIFRICQEKGVKVMAMNMPKNKISWRGARIEKCKEVCYKNNVKFIDFNSKEELRKFNFTLEKDYYDQGHLNARGNFKFSKVLAQKIKELYSLEDHRREPEYADWQRDYEEFYHDYKDVFESIDE